MSNIKLVQTIEITRDDDENTNLRIAHATQTAEITSNAPESITEPPVVVSTPQSSTEGQYFFISLDGMLPRKITSETLSYATNVQLLHVLVTNTAGNGALVHKLYLSAACCYSTADTKEVQEAAVTAGVKKMLKDAYRWLCDHGATSSDKIVLAGFSEGAHAARVLALMITDLGLVNQRYMELVDMMFEHWVGWREQENDAQANEGVRRLRAQFEHVLTYPLRVDTCAVFDTKATLGASSSYELSPSSNTKLRFGRKRIGTIRKVCHAMALDEDHTVFPVDLWEDQELGSLVRSRMRQCWFRGSHIDIGGGSNTVVSTIALMWMVVLLQGDPDLGLLFDTAKMIHTIQNNTVTANVGDLRRWKFESYGQRQRRPGRLSTERAHISARLLQERNLVETLKNSSGPWLNNNRWYWGFSIGGPTTLWEFDGAEYANIHGRDNGSVALEQYYLRMMGLTEYC